MFKESTPKNSLQIQQSEKEGIQIISKIDVFEYEDSFKSDSIQRSTLEGRAVPTPLPVYTAVA